MGLWLEALNLAAVGNYEDASNKLNFELPLLLAGPRNLGAARLQHSSDAHSHHGALSHEVSSFISCLPTSEREMARSREDDLVAFALESIQAVVRRTLNLVRFCRAHPHFSLDQMASGFSDWEGLKRSLDERRNLVADYLRSMLESGIALPQATVQSLGGEGEARYSFNEIALARRWDVELSWRDFKRRNELDRDYMCIDDSEAEGDPESGAEGFDYGSITMAEVVLGSGRAVDDELSLDYRIAGQQLSPELTGLMERMHALKPHDGYRPIAWHNVFWDMISEFEALCLDLETRDPLCDTDLELAAHICQHYPEFGTPSRVTVHRRRKLLSDECRGHVITALLDSDRLNKPLS